MNQIKLNPEVPDYKQRVSVLTKIFAEIFSCLDPPEIKYKPAAYYLRGDAAAGSGNSQICPGSFKATKEPGKNAQDKYGVCHGKS